jgi:hypothetical protein
VSEFGKIYEVEITDCAGYDLIGKALKNPQSRLALHG